MVAADVLKNDIQGHEPLIVNLQTIDETLHRLPMHNRKDMRCTYGTFKCQKWSMVKRCAKTN